MTTLRQQLTCGILVFATCNISTAEQAVIPTPPPVATETAQDRFIKLFTPFRTEMAALSPDGKYIAYTLREGENLSVVTIEVDNPAKLKAKVTVVTDEVASPMMDIQAREKTPAAIRWMRWVNANRLVVETNKNFAYNQGNAAKPATDDGTGSTWFNCAGEVLGFDFDGKNARTLLTPKDIPEFTASSRGKSGTISTPRSPHVVDFSDSAPDSITIHSEGLPWNGGKRYVQRYILNAVTGKLSQESVHSVSVGRAYLFDRQGLPRISVSTSTVDAFPHEFACVPSSMFKQTKTIDQVITGKTQLSFSLSPTNYFGQRSIPLGFGKDPDVLYYASNIGRDTYGLYSVDLTTGKPTSFAAESDVYDLYVPTPGVFPDTNKGTFLGNESDGSIASPFDEPMSTTSVGSMSDTGSSNPSLSALQQRQSEANTQMEALDSSQQEAVAYSGSLAKDFGRSSLLGNLELAPLVFDRFTHDIVGFRYEGKTQTCSWFNPNLVEVQTALEKKYPGRSVDILEWDATYNRFLVRVRGTVDSGAYYVYDRAKTRVSEFVQRAPGLSREKLHETTDISFTDSSGQTISCTFTFPRAARSVPIPVIVLCQPQPWSRVHADFQPELQAFAEMGFAVIQVNTRGVWGFGVKQRESIAGSYETAQLTDIITTIDYLAKRYAINSRRVAIVGKSHGGYLALRALQLFPTRFRCAIAMDSVLDVKSWLAETRWTSADAGPKLISAYFGDPAKLPESELITKPETITKPVFLMNYRGEAGKGETGIYVKAKSLSLSLRRHDIPAELYDLSDDYVNGLPLAKAEAFCKIEDFLNTYIYDFKVKMGDLKIIKED